VSKFKSKCVAVVLVLCGICLAWPIGCSESKSRVSRRSLLERMQQAQMQLDRALTIMTSPTDGPASGHGLNPEALEVLTKAKADLASAISAASDVDAKTGSLANATLARIEMLLGKYYAAQLAHAQRQAHRDLDLAEKSLFLLRMQAGLAGYYGQLGSLDPRELQASREKTSSDIDQMKARQAKLDERIRQLQDEYKQIVAENEALAAEVRNIRRRVAETSRLDVLEQALAKEKRIDENSGRQMQLERSIQALQAQKKELAVVLEASKKVLASLDRALELRTSEARRSEARKDSAIQDVQQTARSVESLLGKVVAAYRQVQQASDEARKAFSSADAAFAKAARLDAKAARLAEQAQAKLETAELDAQASSLMTHSARVADEVSRVFTLIDRPVPAPTGAISNYGRKADAARDSAAKSCQAAADLLNKAVAAAKRERSGLAKSYEVQLACVAQLQQQLAGSAPTAPAP